MSALRLSAPALRPVGDGHAAGQGPGEFDVHGGRPGDDEVWVQRDSGRQRIVQVRQVTVTQPVVGLQVEAGRILDHPDHRIGRRRPGARLVVDAHRRGRRAGDRREPGQDLGCESDLAGHIQPTQDRKADRLNVFRRRPGGKDFGCRLRVERDVPLCYRIGVAAVVVRAAHDHQPAQQTRQCRLLAQRQRQIGQRPDRQPDQLARVRVGRPHPRRCGVIGVELPIGRRQFGVSQAA